MRYCPFFNCRERISDTKFACSRHWYMLTKEQQTVIYECYNGYLADKITFDELRSIQQTVIEEVQKGKKMPELCKCHSCGAEIIWVRSASTGNLMPIDKEPVTEKGNVILKDGVAHIIKGELFDQEEGIEAMMGGPRYISHFATCPNAKKHRKKK